MADPQVLHQAAGTRRLAVFAGSGISVLPPAFLPDWRTFNEAVLDAIKVAASAMLADDPESLAAFDALRIDGIPVQAFSDRVVDGFAGADYFPVLEVLDGSAVNANHKALADLAARGSLRAIVTTNFDTLIERAFAERGVELRVFSRAEDYQQTPAFDEACVLYKIHGSLGADATLVDTVSQKMRGLGPDKRRHLRAVYEAFHTLVVGFSGADLAFGQDYLAFEALEERRPSGPSLSWVIRAGDSTRPEVAQLLDRVGATPLVGVLPDIFGLAGVAFEPSPPDDAPLRAKIAQRVRADVAVRLGTGDHLGARAVIFCAGLLRDIGRTDPAAHLMARLDDAGPGLSRHLALVAFIERGYIALEHDDRPATHAAVEAARAVLEAQAAEGCDTLDSALRRAFARSAASRSSLEGLLAALDGDHTAARGSLERALTAVRDADSPGLEATLVLNLSQAVRHDGDVDDALALAREGSDLAWRAAFPKAVCLAALQEASLLLALVEYDAALACLDAARPRLAWLADARARAQYEVTRATIDYRRGRFEEAWQQWRTVLEGLVGQPELRADLTFMLVPLVARVRGLRDQFVAALRAARAALEGAGGNGVLARHG